MQPRHRFATVAVVLAIGLGGGSLAGCSETSSGGSGGGSGGSAGGSGGFPQDKNGKVSSDPGDYQEVLCNTEGFKDDPSC